MNTKDVLYLFTLYFGLVDFIAALTKKNWQQKFNKEESTLALSSKYNPL